MDALCLWLCLQKVECEKKVKKEKRERGFNSQVDARKWIRGRRLWVFGRRGGWGITDEEFTFKYTITYSTFRHRTILYHYGGTEYDGWFPGNCTTKKFKRFIFSKVTMRKIRKFRWVYLTVWVTTRKYFNHMWGGKRYQLSSQTCFGITCLYGERDIRTDTWWTYCIKQAMFSRKHSYRQYPRVITPLLCWVLSSQGILTALSMK